VVILSTPISRWSGYREPNAESDSHSVG
jgi:hypothetical protein